MATYTEQQIENAKRNYLNFAKTRFLSDYQPHHIGYSAAEQRCEAHNRLIREIKAGNKEVIREQKLFFLNQEVKNERELEARKAKLKANKEASNEVLQPLRELKKVVAFKTWLNTKGNAYRSQAFSNKFTAEAVDAYIATL